PPGRGSPHRCTTYTAGPSCSASPAGSHAEHARCVADCSPCPAASRAPPANGRCTYPPAGHGKTTGWLRSHASARSPRPAERLPLSPSDEAAVPALVSVRSHPEHLQPRAASRAHSTGPDPARLPHRHHPASTTPVTGPHRRETVDRG